MRNMKSVLPAILETKRRDIRRMRGCKSRSDARRGFAVRDFQRAVARKGKTSLIAEIKFASPSAGVIRPPEDPALLARILAGAGAAALSVVTEQTVFQGDPSALSAAARAVSIPVLCKDFLLDEIQVEEAYRLGADAVLLITRILAPERLTALVACCTSLGLSALVEVGTGTELDRALAAGAGVVGINNRDLGDLRVDPGRFGALAPAVPPGVVLVAESGVKGPQDVGMLREQGAHAVLVGTALMSSPDPGGMARLLVAAGEDPEVSICS